MQRIAEYFTPNPDVEIACVVSNSKTAYANQRAKNLGIPLIMIDRQKFNDKAFSEELKKMNVDMIVLAGFLWLIPQHLIEAFPNKIINIHPALIPSFCGLGYYGLKVHEAALARGVKLSGATVHFVNKDLDEGPIILQKAVAVEDGDTPKILQQRIMEQAEWKIMPEAIDLIANDKIEVVDGKVRFKN